VEPDPEATGDIGGRLEALDPNGGPAPSLLVVTKASGFNLMKSMIFC